MGHAASKAISSNDVLKKLEEVEDNLSKYETTVEKGRLALMAILCKVSEP